MPNEEKKPQRISEMIREVVNYADEADFQGHEEIFIEFHPEIPASVRRAAMWTLEENYPDLHLEPLCTKAHILQDQGVLTEEI